MRGDSFLRRSSYEIERVVAASPAAVFRAWTEPALMAKWMWAGLGGEVWAENDLRVGGAYRVCTKMAGGRHHGAEWSCMCGLYAVVEQDRRLVCTGHWDADVGYNGPDRLTLDELMSLALTPEGAGARMLVGHFGIPDDGVSADTHKAGMAQALDMMAALVSGGK